MLNELTVGLSGQIWRPQKYNFLIWIFTLFKSTLRYCKFALKKLHFVRNRKCRLERRQGFLTSLRSRRQRYADFDELRRRQTSFPPRVDRRSIDRPTDGDLRAEASISDGVRRACGRRPQVDLRRRRVGALCRRRCVERPVTTDDGIRCCQTESGPTVGCCTKTRHDKTVANSTESRCITSP